MDASEALDTAKQRAGGPQALARSLSKITSQAISQWKRVPAERVLEVERATGVPRYLLRPDLYPPAEMHVSAPTEAA
jgi:DNA-binding transcriptional regulator YdaS (Cro superfamily)